MGETSSASFTAFVRAHATSLLRLATLLAGDPVTGEDLLQGALERSYRRWPDVMRTGNPEGYVRAALVNAARSRWRTRRRAPERLVESIPDSSFPGVSGGQSEVAVRHALLQALSGLTRQQRTVVVLRYFADQSEAEVARLLSCSVGTVKAHASRGLDRLRQDPRLAMTFDIHPGGVR